MKKLPVSEVVEKSLLILRTISAKNKTSMGKNEIIRATGSKNRPGIFDTIDILKKEQLLGLKKEKKVQKHSVSLTNIGQEIIDLITDISAANEAYASLELKLSEYMSLIKQADALSDSGEKYDEILRQKLLAKGWTKRELESFDKVMESICRLGDFYRQNICNSLLYRYSCILANFNIKENTTEIIKKIILDQITYLLSLHADNYSTPDFAPYRFGDLSESIADEIDSMFHPQAPIKHPNILLNRFTSNESILLMSSLLCIVKLRGLKANLRVADLRSDREWGKKELETSKNKNDVKNIKEFERGILSLEQLEEIYKNYSARYRTYIADTHRTDFQRLADEADRKRSVEHRKSKDN
jgi:hypothetical protein